MSDSAVPFLKGIIAKLVAAGVCGGRVVGAPDPNETYPYCVVSASSEPFTADDFSGMEHTLRVQVFSRQKKPAQALAERAKVHTALHRQEASLSVTGLVSIDQDGVADCFVEDDGKTYQAIMEFKALVT